MLCERYKEALIEASAHGQGEEHLAPKVREHLSVCRACRGVLEMQHMLQTAIAGRVAERMPVDVPTNLMAGVRERVGKEHAIGWSIRWQSAAVVAGIAAVFGIAMVRDSLQRAKTRSNVGVQVFSIPSKVMKAPASPAVEGASNARKGSSKRSTQIENSKVLQAEVEPLVPTNQQEMIEQVVQKIRNGELDGRILRLDVTPETEELQVTPIDVRALEAVTEDKELNPQRTTNRQSRETERSTQ